MSAALLALVRLGADHAWQSTLVVAGIWLLTLVCRRTRASVRHGLWLAASIKFAIPFAALIAIGSSFGWTRAPLLQPQLRLAVDVAAQPFSPIPAGTSRTTTAAAPASANPWFDPEIGHTVLTTLGVIWLLGVAFMLARWSVRWRALRRLIAGGRRVHAGRAIDILRRVDPVTPLPILEVDSTIEPGVAGVVQPVLLWPATISDRLDDEQIAAILSHELAHVRRRDNLTAMLHMAVEAVFWFHPLVWWLSARLVDERERACDEDVLRSGREPQPYAESLLRTCEFYLESSLPCVTGVTGADLKRRIETIMRNRPTATLGRARAALLLVFAITAVAAPIGIGVMRGPRLIAAQLPPGGGAKFDAVSVKRNTSGAQGGTARNDPGRFTATNISLRMLIRSAYNVLDSQIVGGPALATADYMSAEKFDIVATFAGEATREQRNEMMLNLLRDRFTLVAHTEMREMPVYLLTRAKADGALGPSLKPESEECATRRGGAGRATGAPPAATPPAGGPGRSGNPGAVPDLSTVRCGALQFVPGSFTARGVKLDMLTDSLANRTPLTGIDRVVLDRTGLSGYYDYQLVWRPPTTPAGALPPGVTPPAVDPDRPDLFTAVQEQLGLKLETQRAPIEVLVIDRVALRTEN